jgi:hypothetical protein
MQENKESLVHHPHLCGGKKWKKKDRVFGEKDDRWLIWKTEKIVTK